MPITKTPLRYPGGKNKLRNYVNNLITSSFMGPCTYVEPFAGGASIAIHLLQNGSVNRAIINDYDFSVYAFWYSVLQKTDELCQLIQETEVSMEEWYRQKEIQANRTRESDILMLGFSTFFLNRTNRSGILKAGVMGGKLQKGNYKIDCRYNKEDLVSKIKAISKFRDQIELYNLDAIDLIARIIEPMSNDTFIFFDPPYYNKGQSLYVNFYEHDDHVELARTVGKIKGKKWIVTYDNAIEIREIYGKYKSAEYGLSYTVQKKYIGEEIMFFSDNLVPMSIIT